MSERNTAKNDVATLETAPTRYVEGGGIRFAYRQLG
ncbi:MAG: alpha/beta hydrolase, partial [Alphaproteobacteria bacterium]|nr:alpha/beta hydrolase [Alphaproteobacteria bacterium]